MEQATRWTLPLLLGLAASGVTAQAGMDAWGELKNRVGFNGRALLNIKASLKQLGGAPPATPIGPAVGGTDHVYDDGYNLVDGDGNLGGTTYYWGYSSPQVTDDLVAMSSSYASPGGSISEATEDPHWGAELTYLRELGYNNSYWYGMLVGVGWHDVRFSQSQSFSYNATRTTDTYPVIGERPARPYYGSIDSVDGPQIGDSPTRSAAAVPGGAVTAGSYDYDASAYSLRAGLLFETPINDWLDLQFGGGVMGLMVDGRFSVYETTVVNNLVPYTRVAESRSTDFGGGGYAEVNLSLRVGRGIYAYAGAQYLILTDITQSTSGREIQLDIQNGVAASLGMNFAF